MVRLPHPLQGAINRAPTPSDIAPLAVHRQFASCICNICNTCNSCIRVYITNYCHESHYALRFRRDEGKRKRLRSFDEGRPCGLCVIFSIMGLAHRASQYIRKTATEQGGRRLALIGLVLGYLSLSLICAVVFAVITLFFRSLECTPSAPCS
jgi:hypothetical protein